MNKLNIFIFLLSSSTMLFSQKLNDTHLSLIVGTKLFTDDYEGPAISKAWQLKSGLIVGLAISHPKFPHLAVQYFHDEHFLIYAFDRDSISPSTNFFSRTTGNFLGVQYKRKKIIYGIGYYGSFHQDLFNYVILNLKSKKKHVALSFGFELGRTEFEIVKLIQYSKLISVFQIDNQFVSLKYHLCEKKQNKIKSEEQDFKLLIGSRIFAIQNDHLNGEIRNKVGLSFSAGIEYKIKKINTSLYVERDWWMKFNGGSDKRDVSGYVSNSIIGAKLYVPKLNNFFITGGYNFITDNNTLFETWRKIQNGLEKKSLYYYNVKGFCIGFGIPIINNLHLDLRGFIPIQGEKKFNPMRQSLGLTYNILN
ncbi:MAG: hypothetical protein Q7T20_07295 [Saprospiraceae bacterium]|nr:hypothetical protein [Saprospiraceae bacterium]